MADEAAKGTVERIQDAPGGIPTEETKDALHLGDAMDFFLNSKRSGGRSQRTIADYQKKLELFQRWAARQASGEDPNKDSEVVDVPVS